MKPTPPARATTMDGDSSGGLTPISGLDKSFVLAWLRWMESKGPAELRPQSAEQKDEDDLMPYPDLDAIEELFIRDRLAPKAVLDALGGRFPKRVRTSDADPH